MRSPCDHKTPAGVRRQKPQSTEYAAQYRLHVLGAAKTAPQPTAVFLHSGIKPQPSGDNRLIRELSQNAGEISLPLLTGCDCKPNLKFDLGLRTDDTQIVTQDPVAALVAEPLDL